MAHGAHFFQKVELDRATKSISDAKVQFRLICQASARSFSAVSGPVGILVLFVMLASSLCSYLCVCVCGCGCVRPCLRVRGFPCPRTRTIWLFDQENEKVNFRSLIVVVLNTHSRCTSLSYRYETKQGRSRSTSLTHPVRWIRLMRFCIVLCFCRTVIGPENKPNHMSTGGDLESVAVIVFVRAPRPVLTRGVKDIIRK